MAMRTPRTTSRARPGSRAAAKRPARKHSQPRVASADTGSSPNGRNPLGAEWATKKKAWEERYAQSK